MKTRLFGLLLVGMMTIPAMTGCQAGEMAESAGKAMEQGAESIGDAWKQAVEINTETTSIQQTKPALSLEQAQNVALKHAGFTADQVTGLRTEYEIENGVPIYDVEFRHGRWEYDYEIHGDTGEILSFHKDD